MININEAIVKIKNAGPRNVRIVPMKGQNINSGDYQIEIADSGTNWCPIMSGLKKQMAEDIVAQATNRTILG